MTCLEMQAVLPALAEREGPPRVALEAARHLSGCGACAEGLLRLRALHGLLDELPGAEVPATFTRRILRALPNPRWKAGGVLGILALIGVAAAMSSSGAPFASLPSFLRDPFDAASLAATAILRVLFDGVSMLRGALPTGEALPRLSGPAPPAFAGVAALAIFAAFLLAGSGAALGTGALRLCHELRHRSGQARNASSPGL